MANAVSIRIDADAARAISQINATALSLDRLDGAGRKAGASFQRTGQTLTRVGSTMTRNLSVPIALAGGAAVKTAIDFDQSMNRIQALVGASAEQVDRFSKSILSLAPTVGKSPKELADALYFITSSGFSGAKALDVLTVSAEASASGLGDTQTVADAVTSAVNAYGKSVLSATAATDVLTATVREGKGEPTELAAALGQVVAPAQALGISFDQVGGALSSLTLLGLDASESATALRGTFTAMLKPSAAAVDVLKQAGLSAAELRNQIRDKGLLPTLQALRDRFGDNQETLAKLFPNVRALNGFLILTGKNAENNQKIFDKVAKSQGDTAAAFEKTGQAARQQLNESLAELQVTGVGLGNDLIPVLVDVAGGVATLADGFSQLSPGMQHFIEITGATVAALGPVTSAVGNVSKVAGVAQSGFLKLATQMGGMGPAGAAIGVAGLVIIGALATIRGGTSLTESAFEELSRSAQAAGDAIREASSADITAAQAKLDLTRATRQHGEDVRAVSNALSRYGKGSKEYRDALLAESQSQLDVRSALLRRRDATESATAADRKAVKQLRDVQQKFNDQAAAVRRATARTSEGVDKAKLFADGMRDLAAGLTETAQKAHGVNPALEATALKLLREASAAAALANALNRIPSRIETEIFIQRTTQLTTIEDNRLVGRPHAVGGITRRQITLPSGDVFGEPSTGGEAILPLKSPGGREALATAVATALKHVGAGGATYNVTINTQNLDARKLKRELDLLTARRG